MYSKAQDEAKAPTLEKEVAELHHKLVEVTKARNVLGHQIKKVPQLEAKVASLKHANNVQLSIHQTKIQRLRQEYEAHLEGKNAFCNAEKGRVLSELRADYQAMLPALYDEQYNLGYWAGYAVG